MHRTITDRLLDWVWARFCGQRQITSVPPRASSRKNAEDSISGTLAWPNACAALAAGAWNSNDFRRTFAVRQVVETLGLADGIYFARLIQREHPEWLDDRRFWQINDWGNPFQAPAWLLGTRRAFSPTSLRYLAHALWLKDGGYIKPEGVVIELGVGFGGLAAMNALVSKASTVMVDLPEVESAARIMMGDNALDAYVLPKDTPLNDACFISNYAFTELSTELQNHYSNEIIQIAARGAILSNAKVFSAHIGGRDDDELIASLLAIGIRAIAERDVTILGPADQSCGISLIHW